jgi:hypothetical protein
MTKVAESALKAERALLQIVAEGGKVSQFAIEQKAGLANGALNYKHPLYIDLKRRILETKSTVSNEPALDDKFMSSLAKEKHLKDKYRIERNQLAELLRVSEGERLELQYQLYHMQKYLTHLENSGLADLNVLRSSNLRKVQNND